MHIIKFGVVIILIVGSICGCSKKKDLIARIRGGDMVTGLVIEVYDTNGVPTRLTTSDARSVQWITQEIGIAGRSYWPVLGSVFGGEITLASGFRENVSVAVQKGGTQFSIGVGAAFGKDPAWYTVAVSESAPSSIATNMEWLAPP